MLTDRQLQLLKALVEAYAEVASPVGSVVLAKIFNLSSATIRSELSELEKKGYIFQPHTSAGRIPTDKGYRVYVNSLSEDKDIRKTLAKSASSQERAILALNTCMDNAGLPEQAIRNAVDLLVMMTHNLGLATIGDQVYFSGIANLFNNPEFANYDSMLEVAKLLDNLEPWLREVKPNEALNVYIGRENPIGGNSGCSLIISRFSSPYSDNSYIGILGPTRQNYSQVINLVQNAGSKLNAYFN